MRVITGIARGRRLETLVGNDVRPTADKVKEAIFSAEPFAPSSPRHPGAGRTLSFLKFDYRYYSQIIHRIRRPVFVYVAYDFE